MKVDHTERRNTIPRPGWLPLGSSNSSLHHFWQSSTAHRNHLHWWREFEVLFRVSDNVEQHVLWILPPSPHWFIYAADTRRINHGASFEELP